MKEYLKILGIIALLVMGISFFIYGSSNFSATGQVVSELGVGENEALNAVLDSENILIELREEEFHTGLVEDLLIEANNKYVQAKYASYLRGDVLVNDYELIEARKTLALIDWRNLYYSDVIEITNEIKASRDKSFYVHDLIIIEESKLVLNDFVSNETSFVLESAKVSFEEGRNNEAEELIELFETYFEEEKIENSRKTGFVNSTKSFFVKYWIQVLGFVAALIFILVILERVFEKRRVQRKIRKLAYEQKVLVSLMKKAQKERFEKNKISGLVYNLRMARYQEKLENVKSELPILEKKLLKFHK